MVALFQSKKLTPFYIFLTKEWQKEKNVEKNLLYQKM